MKKKFLQKQRGILVALLGFLCVFSVKAQTDLTSLITNPSFESGLSPWIWNVGASWLGPNNSGDGTKAGTYVNGIWNASIGDAECAQTLTVANGFYKVTALATVCNNSSTTQRLFATSGGITKSTLYGASNNHAYSVANLAILAATETYSFGGYAESSSEEGPFKKLTVVKQVTDGSLKIGFRVNGKGNKLGYNFSYSGSRSDAGFFKFDNFTLTEVSTVATLDNITLSTGTLDATFSPSTITYTATLPAATTTVTPTTTVTADGEIVSGAGAVDVSSGTGSSTILVTALDGTTTKTYAINYTVSTIPTITPSKTQFSLSGLGDRSISESLTVSGAHLTGDISISAPDGITVNPTSLPAGAVDATVTVTWDGTTVVNGNITFTSGSATTNVAVTGAQVTTVIVTDDAADHYKLVSRLYLIRLKGTDLYLTAPTAKGDADAYRVTYQTLRDKNVQNCQKWNIQYNTISGYSNPARYTFVSGIDGATNWTEDNATVVGHLDWLGRFRDDNTATTQIGAEGSYHNFTVYYNGTAFGLYDVGGNRPLNIDATTYGISGPIQYLYEFIAAPNLYDALNNNAMVNKVTTFVRDNKVVSSFNLDAVTEVSISLYNMNGMLIESSKSIGQSGKNERVMNTPLSSGAYMVRTSINGKFTVNKIIL